MILARERISVHPEDADARLIFGISLLKAGRDGEALAIFEKIGEDIQRWACVFEYLGDILSTKGDMEKAMSCYQSFLGLEPNSMKTKRLLKKIDSLLDGEQGAGEKLSNGVSGDFKTITVAELYLRQGHIELAEKVLKEILQNQPDNEKAVELLRQIRDRTERNAGLRERTSSDAVNGELNRWLRNLRRLNSDRC
jgi:tetratricopeptide (TPR) repeat protein